MKIRVDTFAGLYGTTSQDGSSTLAKDGVYATPAGYEQYLSDVLAYHESEAPIPHLRKFEIVKGDASQTIIEYFARHPETIVAMAYFDFDIYTPTKACLEAIHPHVVKNSVLVFDELDCPEYPGETRALMETFGLGKCTLRRSPLTPWMSYTTCENIAG